MTGAGEPRVRGVREGEGARLRELRLRALAADPDAFGGTYEQVAQQTVQWWESRVGDSVRGVHDRWLIAEDGAGAWVGMALVHAEPQSRSAEIFGMWVAPEARGTGTAQRLCEAARRWGRERGYERICVAVAEDNARAIGAYRKAGFVDVGSASQQFHGRTLDVRLMEQALACTGG